MIYYREIAVYIGTVTLLVKLIAKSKANHAGEFYENIPIVLYLFNYSFYINFINFIII